MPPSSTCLASNGSTAMTPIRGGTALRWPTRPRAPRLAAVRRAVHAVAGVGVGGHVGFAGAAVEHRGSAGSTASAPICCGAFARQLRRQVAPASLLFHTPPPAAPSQIVSASSGWQTRHVLRPPMFDGPASVHALLPGKGASFFAALLRARGERRHARVAEWPRDAGPEPRRPALVVDSRGPGRPLDVSLRGPGDTVVLPLTSLLGSACCVDFLVAMVISDSRLSGSSRTPRLRNSRCDAIAVRPDSVRPRRPGASSAGPGFRLWEDHRMKRPTVAEQIKKTALPRRAHWPR